MAFFFSIAVRLPNDKDRKAKRSEISNKLELALAINFIKNLVNNMAKVIAKRVNS